MNNPNIIVTGATGNIGSKLLRSLNTYRAIGTSRNSSYDEKIIFSKDLKKLPKCNVLIHLAEENERTKANELGMSHLKKMSEQMDNILNQDIEHVIFASSALVYSDNKQHKRKPDENITPNDFYTESKLINEEKVLKSNGTVARISNVISEQYRTGVISEIISQLNIGEDVKLNDTSPVRDFIFIDDIISCLNKMAVTKKSGVFNVGSGVGTSILDLTAIIAELMNKDNIKISSRHNIKGPISTLVLDITKTKKRFNWKPKFTVSSGLKKIVEKI